MFELFGNKKRLERLEEETKNSFSSVKKDFANVGGWIKHLDSHKKRHGEHFSQIKRELSTIKGELENLKELISLAGLAEEHEQLSKKSPF